MTPNKTWTPIMPTPYALFSIGMIVLYYFVMNATGAMIVAILNLSVVVFENWLYKRHSRRERYKEGKSY